VTGGWRPYDRRVDLPVVIPLTLLALGLSALGALVRPRWDVAVVLGLLAAIWTRVNGPVEGAILHTWSAGRGFTEADLVSVVALVVSAVTLLRCAWRLARRLAGPGAGRSAPSGTAPVSSAGSARGGAGHQGP